MSHSAHAFPEAVSYDELTKPGNELPGWLWQGFIAFESITLLTSRWKMGKTTLLAVLLSRLRTGGALAGLEVTAAPALIVSEETPTLWFERGRHTPFGHNVRWLCRPFGGKPNREQWTGFVDHLRQLAGAAPSLIVIDPLALVLPGHDENNAGPIIDALTPLQQLAGAGHAVLMLHHPRKGRTLEPRGSGAIAGIVDIIMHLDGSSNEAEHPRRRWLRARGRRDGVVAERLIELNADHTDYEVVDAAAEDLTDGIGVIEWVLNDANQKYSRDQILENWPEKRGKPHKSSLWKWLEQAVAEGRILSDGEGRKHKPFRYWLRHRERFFFPDLPPLDPLPYAPEITPEEIEFAEKVVGRDNEEKRRETERRRGRA